MSDAQTQSADRIEIVNRSDFTVVGETRPRLILASYNIRYAVGSHLIFIVNGVQVADIVDPDPTYAGEGAAAGAISGAVLGGLAGILAAGLVPGVGQRMYYHSQQIFSTWIREI